MNILRRIYDKATGVLGYDCQGEPLRRGDLVEPAPDLSDAEVDKGARCQMIVYRLPHSSIRVGYGMTKPVLILLNPYGSKIYATEWAAIRKVPQWEQQARWENLERLTGWSPQVVKEGEVTQ